MPSKAATTTAPARGSRKVGRPIRGVMVRDIFAAAERSDIDALATRLDPAGRPAIAGLAITALANRTGDAAQYFLRAAAHAETKRRRAQMETEAQLCAHS
jgi:hypothetical protein